MTAIDIIWIFLWFLVGLVVFQIRGIKSFWGQTTDTYSAITIIPIILGFFYGAITLQDVTMSLVGSIILSTITTLAYLIGANISRAAHFGHLSPRIIFYVFFFFMFLVIFKGVI